MINAIINFGGTFLKGKGTYTVGWVSIVWAVTGVLLGQIDLNTATVIVTTALSAIGIRRNMPSLPVN